MQAFGLELRKKGSISNLYSDVDSILRASGITRGEVNKNVQASAVAHALQKMLKTQSFFDVCTIRDCAQVCHAYISAPRMDVYKSIHCVSWNDMLPDFRQQVIAMILDDFRSILNPSEQ